MTIEQQLQLSYYRDLGELDARHGVRLVQHVETGRVFVQKSLDVYDLRVYRRLKEHPVPGIPRIRELVEDSGVLLVIEDYITGTPLRTLLDQSGPFSEEQAVDIVSQLCRILQPLHHMTPPIIHRDLKPGNLIITPEGRVVLVDFNTARESHPGQAHDTMLLGTVGYAAPEQFGFSSSTPATDIYALGVLLNELLTGCLPDQQPASGRLAAVIRTCLQMDPANRYQSTDALLDALTPPGQRSGAGLVRRLRPWLPPGLRSTKLRQLIPGICWYVFFTVLSFTMTFTEPASRPELWVSRMMFFSLFLSQTLWLGNYRRVWQRLPLSSSARLPVRILGVALWSAVWFCSLIMGFGILGALLR